MNEHSVITDEEAKRAKTMHQVYTYLLQLAARKEAASRVEFGDLSRKSAHDPPAHEPSVEGV